MSEMVDERIVVIASLPSDRVLIEEILKANALRSPSVVGDAPADATEPDRAPRATIVCHRGTPDVPVPILPDVDARSRVIVLSDCTSEQAVVDALESGAHHYFDIAEPHRVLAERISAALRSHAGHARRQLVVPPFRFDLAKRRVWRDDRAVGLSPKEFDLAFYLFSNRGRTVGNRELMIAVWSLPRSMDSRRIDTAACRVRKKMALGDGDDWHLRRLRGEGYQLTTDTREVPRVPGEDETPLSA